MKTHTFTVGGKRYQMPELWAIGYCAAHIGSSIYDAALVWAFQQDAAELHSRSFRSTTIHTEG